MRILTRSLPALCIALSATCGVMVSTSCNRYSKSCASFCANGGVCEHGVCNCPTGYQGTDCNTLSRTAFLGNWTAHEQGTVTDATQYAVSITPASPGINDVMILNLMNYFTTPVNAYVVNETISIPLQQLQGNSIQGTGFLVNKMIVISYDVTNLTTYAVMHEADTLQQSTHL